MHSSRSARGGSNSCKFSGARNGSQFAKFLERTRGLEICQGPGAHSLARNLQSSRSARGGPNFCKIPGAHAMARNLQGSWSARGASKFAKVLERTRWLEICKVPGAHVAGRISAKFLERTQWLAICKAPGAHAKARNLQSSRAVVRVLQSSRSARGGSKIAKPPERTRGLEFCKVRSQVLLKSPAFRPSLTHSLTHSPTHPRHNMHTKSLARMWPNGSPRWNK